jgi:hypothetical protein
MQAALAPCHIVADECMRLLYCMDAGWGPPAAASRPAGAGQLQAASSIPTAAVQGGSRASAGSSALDAHEDPCCLTDQNMPLCMCSLALCSQQRMVACCNRACSEQAAHKVLLLLVDVGVYAGAA